MAAISMIHNVYESDQFNTLSMTAISLTQAVYDSDPFTQAVYDSAQFNARCL